MLAATNAMLGQYIRKKDNFHFLKPNIFISQKDTVDKRKWAEQCSFDTCALCEIPDDIFSAAHLDDIFSELHSLMTSCPWIAPRSSACGGQGRWWHVCGEISAGGATATYFDDISRLFNTWTLAWSAFGAWIHSTLSLSQCIVSVAPFLWHFNVTLDVDQ